jgi:hypothetical protein
MMASRTADLADQTWRFGDIHDPTTLTIVRAAHVGVVALKHCGNNGSTGECERIPAFAGLNARFSTRLRFLN